MTKQTNSKVAKDVKKVIKSLSPKKETSKVKVVSQKQLLDVLKKVDGGRSCYVSLMTVTDARAKKKDNEIGNIVKISKSHGRINCNYKNSVQNQLERDGELASSYIPGKRAYGIKKDEFNGCLLFGSNEPQLVVDIASTHVKYYATELEKVVDETKITNLLPKKAEGEIVSRRNYNLSSVRKLKVNGITYKVK